MKNITNLILEVAHFMCIKSELKVS